MCLVPASIHVCSHGWCLHQDTCLLTWLCLHQDTCLLTCAWCLHQDMCLLTWLVPASNHVFAYMAGACIKIRVCLHGWCLHQITCLFTWLMPASRYVFAHVDGACIKMCVLLTSLGTRTQLSKVPLLCAAARRGQQGAVEFTHNSSASCCFLAQQLLLSEPFIAVRFKAFVGTRKGEHGMPGLV